MTEPKPKSPRKPRAKKTQPTNAELMDAIKAISARMDANDAATEELRQRLNLSLEQTRTEANTFAQAGREQDKATKSLIDVVQGDGRIGLVQKNSDNERSIELMQKDIENVTNAVKDMATVGRDIQGKIVVGVISLVVAVVLLALNLAIGTGIFQH